MIKNASTIKDLLKGNYLYKIPRFQRSFSWEKEQWEKFWYDVLETIDEGRKDYFIGTMIFKRDEEDPEGRIEIIDGQQRMVIITIVFACIRDEYIRNTFRQDYGREIERDFIGERDKRTEQWCYKLKLNIYDENYFNDNIQRTTAETREKRFGPRRNKNILQSHRLIRKAYDFFKDSISKELQRYKDPEDKEKFLFELEDTIAKKFKVIIIDVNDEDDTSLIFETLNDRGLELSESDLLKNYIYSTAEKTNQNLSLIQREWEDILLLLIESKEFTNFLRYYWNSCYGFLRKNQLYQEYKRYLKGQKDLLKFVNGLKEEAKNYKSLIEPTSNIWKSQKVINLLKDLRLLGVKQIYPLLLSGYRRLEDKDFLSLLEISLNLTFRYSIICNQNPNQLEKIYSKLANELHKNEINLDKIIKRLKQLYLYARDDFFVQEFSSKKIKNSQIARYILIQINNYLIKEKKEMKVINDPETVNLEHIMPKVPTQWKEYIKKNEIVHDELIDMIGNLTLLPSSINKDVSNKPFQDKCKIYKNLHLPTTKSICADYKIWNKDSVIRRQKKLADIARNIWKI